MGANVRFGTHLLALSSSVFSIFNSFFRSVLNSLPQSVRRRVNALKNLQVKSTYLEAQFYQEVHELERKYAGLYEPLFGRVSPAANDQ